MLLMKPGKWLWKFIFKNSLILSEMNKDLFEKLTFEQVGVKAPGTPMRIPFFPAKSSWTLTLVAGESSNSSPAGNFDPTYLNE